MHPTHVLFYQGTILCPFYLRSPLRWYPWDPTYWDMTQHKEYAGTRVSNEHQQMLSHPLLMHVWVI